MKFIWLKISGVCAAAAFGIFFIVKKIRTGQNADNEDLTQIIVNGIKDNSEVFDGLYEGLFQAVRNREMYFHDAYEEWCFRADHLDNEAFRTAFAEKFSEQDIANEWLCRNKMDILLSCIGCAGIIRERENGKSYIADEAMCRAYLTINGGKPDTDKEYTVLKSAWINSGNKVIEYGMVIPASG